ncbi:MAG TPA: hypothetical protein GXX29_03675 [Firmicutes bacterium]|nr:hypothetical protein [Bacillota bacterium]
MSTLNREIRRKILRPLVQSESGTINSNIIARAVKRLDEYAMADEHVASLCRDALVVRQKGSGSWKDPSVAIKFIELVKALYSSRRISKQEFVFYAAMPAIHIHEERWTDGYYDDELQQIVGKIERVRAEYGLANDEYWPLGEGPLEYRRLNEEYESVLVKKLISTFREFGLDELAEMKEKSPDEFDVDFERGRRSIFHRDEKELILRDIVVRYEKEAQNAAATGAYFAAITSLGAGVEGLLILKCLRSPHKAARIAKKLPKRIRPRYEHDPMTWTFETLIEVCLRAGWLPKIETSVAVYNSAELAHRLRQMRNYVHPSRNVVDRPWIEMDEREYLDAYAIYIVLFTVLGKVW